MRWIVLTVAGCVLASAWARTIPVDAERASGGHAAAAPALAAPRAPRAPNPLALLHAAEAAYRQHARADSLLPLLPASPGIVIALSPLLPTATIDSVKAATEREMSELGTVRARLGVFIVDKALGQYDGLQANALEEHEAHVGSDSAGVYCAMIAAAFVTPEGQMNSSGFGTARRAGARPTAGSTVLGPCMFIARYGLPGPGVDRWLRDGGYRFATLRGSASVDNGPIPPVRYYWAVTAEDRLLRGCRGGRQDMCTDAVMPTARSASNMERTDAGAAVFNLVRQNRGTGHETRTLLHDLERQHGPDRFARFWTSDADVRDAFASAFDQDIDAWVRDWSQSRYGVTMLGARVGPASIALSMLSIALLAAAATVVARRRSV